MSTTYLDRPAEALFQTDRQWDLDALAKAVSAKRDCNYLEALDRIHEKLYSLSPSTSTRHLLEALDVSDEVEPRLRQLEQGRFEQAFQQGRRERRVTLDEHDQFERFHADSPDVTRRFLQGAPPGVARGPWLLDQQVRHHMQTHDMPPEDYVKALHAVEAQHLEAPTPAQAASSPGDIHPEAIQLDRQVKAHMAAHNMKPEQYVEALYAVEGRDVPAPALEKKLLDSAVIESPATSPSRRLVKLDAQTHGRVLRYMLDNDIELDDFQRAIEAVLSPQELRELTVNEGEA